MNLHEQSLRPSQYDSYESLLKPLIATVQKHILSLGGLKTERIEEHGLIRQAEAANQYLGPILYLPLPVVSSAIYFVTTFNSDEAAQSWVVKDLLPAHLFGGAESCFLEDDDLQDIVESKKLDNRTYITSYVDSKGSMFCIFIPELIRLEPATGRNNKSFNVAPLSVSGLLEVHVDPS